MNVIIQSNFKTLTKSKNLLNYLTDSQLSNVSVSPYYSSIGTHIRHILDFYACIFNLSSENKIDLTARDRDGQAESKCESAKCYLNTILEKLENIEFNMDDVVEVYDDLGSGKIAITYTYGALFSQANSHTIHHYAIINYIMTGLNIIMEDSAFGFNPTTPRQPSLN